MRRVRELEEENARLRGLLGLDERCPDGQETAWAPTLLTASTERTPIDATATNADKLALLWSLFGARSNVFAIRWENASTGRSGWSQATRGGWSRRRSAKDYLPLTDDVFTTHLRGDLTAGIYPLLPGDTCALLVCDFDRGSWALDALAYLDACQRHRRPSSVGALAVGQGRSRVGVAASSAREAPAARRRRMRSRSFLVSSRRRAPGLASMTPASMSHR